MFFCIVSQVIIADKRTPFIPVVIIEDDYSISKNNFTYKIIDNLKFPGFQEFHIVTNDQLKSSDDFYIDDAIYILCNRDENLIQKFYSSSNFNDTGSSVYSLVKLDLTHFTSGFLKIRKTTRIITTYIDDDSIFKSNILPLESTTGHKITFEDYGYYILFSLLHQGYINSGTLTPIGLINSMYGKKILTNQITLIEHNYLISIYWIVEYKDKVLDDATDTSYLTIMKYAYPNDYFDPDEVMGNVPLMYCSWKDNALTGKTLGEYYIILFLNPNSGISSQNAQFISNVQVATIELMNHKVYLLYYIKLFFIYRMDLMVNMSEVMFLIQVFLLLF